MAIDTNKMKSALQAELDTLRQLGGDLKVQAALARDELRDEWNRLERRLELAQEEINRVSEHAKAPLHDIETAARKLLEEVKNGFDRIRKAQ